MGIVVKPRSCEWGFVIQILQEFYIKPMILFTILRYHGIIKTRKEVYDDLPSRR